MVMLGKGVPPPLHPPPPQPPPPSRLNCGAERELVLELLSDTCSPPCRPSGSPNNPSRKGREKSFVNHSAHQQSHFPWDSTAVYKALPCSQVMKYSHPLYC